MGHRAASTPRRQRACACCATPAARAIGRGGGPGTAPHVPRTPASGVPDAPRGALRRGRRFPWRRLRGGRRCDAPSIFHTPCAPTAGPHSGRPEGPVLRIRIWMHSYLIKRPRRRSCEAPASIGWARRYVRTRVRRYERSTTRSIDRMASRVTYHVTPYVNGWQEKEEG